MTKNKSEEIQDFSEMLHLATQGERNLWTVFIPHSVYKIKVTGFLSYIGNGIWKVDHVEFPVDSVETITLTTRNIFLR